MRIFHRYVAIGDSTTEGLDDPDGRGGFCGWANRLAVQVDAAQTAPLEYANLAVRGLTLAEIRTTQFDRALALGPDLMTIVGGVNDVIGARPDFAQLATDFEAMFGEARQADITVLTFTMPDPSHVNPLGRVFKERMDRLNAIVRATAQRYGVAVMDFTDHPVAVDPRLWSDDRLHGNPTGHQRMADALAWRLGIDGADASWTDPLEEMPPRGRRERIAGDFQWARTHFVPWVGRGIRGVAESRGVVAKRPEPLPVDAGELLPAV